MTSIRNSLLAVVAASALVGGCANPYQRVGYGYFVRGDQPLTAEAVAHQDQNVTPRCEEWSRQTNPSPNRMAAANAWNNLLGGGAGGAASNVVSNAITGGAITGVGIASAGAGYAAVAIPMGAVAGYTAGQGAIHGWTKNCLAMDAGGLHAVPPSEGEQIRQTGQARSYGRRPAPAQAETPAQPSETGDDVIMPPPGN